MCHDQVISLRSSSLEKDHLASVFDTTFHPNVEKGQYTPPIEDLAADAYSFVLAGTDTSSHATTTGIFELLDGSPHMMKRLQKELVDAIPNRDQMVEWATLEKLPYLVCSMKIVQAQSKADRRHFFSVLF